MKLERERDRERGRDGERGRERWSQSRREGSGCFGMADEEEEYYYLRIEGEILE